MLRRQQLEANAMAALQSEELLTKLAEVHGMTPDPASPKDLSFKGEANGVIEMNRQGGQLPRRSSSQESVTGQAEPIGTA